MNKEELRVLLAAGHTKRQIAKNYNLPRWRIEEMAREIRGRKSRVHRSVFFSIATAAAFFTFVWRADLWPERWRPEPTQFVMHQKILAAVDQGVKPRLDLKSWWMENPNSGANLARDVATIENIKQRVERLLSDNLDIAEVRLLKDEFSGHIYPTMFTAGISRSVIAGKHEGAILPIDDPKMLEISFFGYTDFYDPMIGQRLLAFNPNWPALMIGAINYTDSKWFASNVIHELWHAKRFREKAPSSVAPLLSDLWISEELEAHGLGTKVLDIRTGGEYGQTLKTIASHRDAATLVRFLSNLTAADLREIDSLFESGIREEVDTRAAGYLFDLARHWVAAHYPSGEIKARETLAYRLLVSPQSTNVR